MAEKLLSDPGIGVSVFAEGILLLLAMQAAPAGYGEWIHDAVADLQILDRAADLHHFAHEFVAQDIARHHGWNEPAEQMQVGTTNGRGCDAYDTIARVKNFRIGDVF